MNAKKVQMPREVYTGPDVTKEVLWDIYVNGEIPQPVGNAPQHINFI